MVDRYQVRVRCLTQSVFPLSFRFAAFCRNLIHFSQLYFNFIHCVGFIGMFMDIILYLVCRRGVNNNNNFELIYICFQEGKRITGVNHSNRIESMHAPGIFVTSHISHTIKLFYVSGNYE